MANPSQAMSDAAFYDLEKKVARLESQVEHLQDQISQLNKSLDTAILSVTKLNSTLDQLRGAKYVIGALVVVAALIAKWSDIIGFFVRKP